LENQAHFWDLSKSSVLFNFTDLYLIKANPQHKTSSQHAGVSQKKTLWVPVCDSRGCGTS